ncbi:hypothetical protein [Paenibacillus naphthalenovorans]|uniref:Uncharacterized protein n=1 Tax=Paenibacillus naphthalenovorans TaxID=162209 RepID=A0A0U2WA24_9BACL|nr:hypothetical protein [Paenibacillus naphthalenovorans]ALS22218.1 hypothetical protein IJ22_18440 [Paenibacillus naphthalenovorans]
MHDLKETISRYESTLVRKKNLVKPFHFRKSKGEDLDISEHTRMLILEAEIQQLDEIIEDLKYIVSR